MKASISNRIYLRCDEVYHTYILSQLTYKIPPRMPNGFPEIICDVFRIKNISSIPVGRKDLIPEGYEIKDLRTSIPTDFKGLNPLIKFRENQIQAIKYTNDNVIINAKPAWGKTFTAIGIAAKLRQKTLIVVHTIALREQWEIEVCKILPHVKPGIIGSGRFEINSPIVIGNVQSLNKSMDNLTKEFGLIIMDECHHVPASTFKRVLDKSKAKYKIGLTATLGRKDKKHILIPDYISSDVFVASDENSMVPKVIMVYSDIPLDDGIMIPWGTKINKLVGMPEYNQLILDVSHIQAEKGHKVLCVSDRVEFLQNLNANSVDSRFETDLFIGATKNRREVLKHLRNGFIDILFASQKIFAEGVSENSLSCLVLAQPINNVWLLEQLCGRVTRKAKNKIQPVIIDIVLKGTTGKNQSVGRENYYINKGWEVEKI